MWLQKQGSSCWKKKRNKRKQKKGPCWRQTLFGLLGKEMFYQCPGFTHQEVFGFSEASHWTAGTIRPQGLRQRHTLRPRDAGRNTSRRPCVLPLGMYPSGVVPGFRTSSYQMCTLFLFQALYIYIVSSLNPYKNLNCAHFIDELKKKEWNQPFAQGHTSKWLDGNQTEPFLPSSKSVPFLLIHIASWVVTNDVNNF